MYLRQTAMPARQLITAGVPVAVATDFNPGSAPSYHLPLALTLACTLLGMTPAEALKGGTLYAARAVGLENSVGSLEPGKLADFAIIDAPDPEHWLYNFRPNACVMTAIGGVPRWNSMDLQRT
jgi:imidazolonepropionase